MNVSQSVRDEIEENVRFCEELMKKHPNFVPEKTDLDLGFEFDDLWNTAEYEKQKAEVPSGILDLYEPEIPVIPQQPVTIPKPDPAPKHAPVAKHVPVAKPVHKSKSSAKKGSAVLKTIRSFFICIVIALVFGFLLTTFVVNHTMVDGSSMEPTIHNGDHLVVEKVSYLIGQPERFDIIEFEHRSEVNYIKRIVGLPGERVRIGDGKIYINDAAIYDTHDDGRLIDSGIAAETITLGMDEYFVLGDNRDGSEDSRSENVGPVKADKIKGRAWLRVAPFEQFGSLE